MNTPNTISKDIKTAMQSMCDFAESDCHLEDLIDCFGFLKSRIDEAEKLKKAIQGKLIDQGHLSESGDAIQSDSFRVLFSLRAKPDKLDKEKLRLEYSEAYNACTTRGHGSSAVITSKSVT